MARKKRNRGGTTGTTPRSGATNIVIRNDDRNGTGGAIRKRGGRGGKRRTRGGGAGSNMDIGKAAIAGFGFGLVEQVADRYSVPTVPVLGRKGTIALACYFLRKQHPLIADIARAGITISTYQLAAEGKVTGEDY